MHAFGKIFKGLVILKTTLEIILFVIYGKWISMSAEEVRHASSVVCQVSTFILAQLFAMVKLLLEAR